MDTVLDKLYDIVWGIPALVLILGVGAYLSIRTGFAQLRLFPKACCSFWRCAPRWRQRWAPEIWPVWLGR